MVRLRNWDESIRFFECLIRHGDTVSLRGIGSMPCESRLENMEQTTTLNPHDHAPLINPNVARDGQQECTIVVGGIQEHPNPFSLLKHFQTSIIPVPRINAVSKLLTACGKCHIRSTVNQEKTGHVGLKIVPTTKPSVFDQGVIVCDRLRWRLWGTHRLRDRHGCRLRRLLHRLRCDRCGGCGWRWL